MGFNEEIVKPKRKVTPFLLFSRDLNTGNWDGPDHRLYSSKFDATGARGIESTVESFGTFSRSCANSLYSLEIPTITTRLLDPHFDWRRYANEPYDTILRKWIHYLLRVHDDNDNPFDATVALGQIVDLRYPPSRRVSITATVAAPELMGERIPRRTITLDDWPNAPAESIGLPVPILYGRLSNSVLADDAEEVEESDVPGCCPEWTPDLHGPMDQHHHPDIRQLRWSDHFSNYQGHDVNALDHYGSGSTPDPTNLTDAWIAQNYVQVVSCSIVPGLGEFGGPALSVINGDGFGEITRPVGPMWIGDDAWDMENPPGGRWAGQYGACGMRRKILPEYADLAGAPVFDVWGRGETSGAAGDMMQLLTWDDSVPGQTTDLRLFLNGIVHRRNGADGWWPTPPTNQDDISGYWRTPAMNNILRINEWQTIEMKWKISTITDPYMPGLLASRWHFIQHLMATTAKDGWVQVRVDGQLVLYLQEIQFFIVGLPKTGATATLGQPLNLPEEAISYWDGIAFKPQGVASCVYITDRLYCDEATPTVVEEADPCADNVTETGRGAIICPLVDSSVSVSSSLQRVTSMTPARENSTAIQPPTNVTGYISNLEFAPEQGKAGMINVVTYYVVTAIKTIDGVLYESAPSPEQALVYESELSEISFLHFSWQAHIVWDASPTPGVEGYRVYQSTEPGIQLHVEQGGVLQQNTVWVTEHGTTPDSSGYPTGDPRDFHQGLQVVGQGTPFIPGASSPTDPELQETTTETEVITEEHTADFLLCGHAVAAEDIEVFVPLPGLREVIGGLNLLTGEKEPISFEETADRMTKLTPGADYDVLTVEKPSGRFTIIHVKRDIRDNNTCQYPPISVNCSGCRTNADGTGTLIEVGPKILEHFLLNWVFNHYQTGDWFNDVASAPGLVDRPSFDQAAADILAATGMVYIGAVALVSPADVRTLIQEALTTFGLNFFYKNALAQPRGAWSVTFEDLRRYQSEWATAPLFTPDDDMIAETFETALSVEMLRNVIHFKAGPNLGQNSQRGWIITGSFEDPNSISRYGRLEMDLLLPWTRDQATAIDRGVAELQVRRFPIVVGGFQAKGRGVLISPGTIIRVGHDDAPGLGWDDRAALVIGNDLALDAGGVGLRFISPVSMIE